MSPRMSFCYYQQRSRTPEARISDLLRRAILFRIAPCLMHLKRMTPLTMRIKIEITLRSHRITPRIKRMIRIMQSRSIQTRKRAEMVTMLLRKTSDPKRNGPDPVFVDLA
jgi:hypothetical protein